MLPQEQINTYIADQPDWQRKVLVRMRQLIHSTDKAIEENWRWNAPAFDHDGIMVGIHGFKHHVAAWFHKGAMLKDTHGVFEKPEKGEDKGMRSYKVLEGDALDEKAFIDLVKQAVKLNRSGVKLHEARPAGKALVVPSELESVLKKDDTAWEHWEKFSHTHKKEYVEWVTDAKQEETRKRRIAQALEMIREGLYMEDKHHV